MSASREYVCIRLQTYEDAQEAKVLAWVFSDRLGNLHNTSFGILSSDGKSKLTQTGRSPSMVYGSADRFEEALVEIAKREGTHKKKSIEGLPVVQGLRLALDDSFLELWRAIAEQSPSVERLVYMADGEAPGEMSHHERLIADNAPMADADKGGDDLAGLFYTGGTTGMPKGVLWRQGDAFQSALYSGNAESLEAVVDRAARGGPRVVASPPFMHGAAH